MCFSFLVAILCLDKSTRQCSPERKTSALSVLNQPDRKSDLFCGTHSTEASVSLSECFPFWNFRSTTEIFSSFGYRLWFRTSDQYFRSLTFMEDVRWEKAFLCIENDYCWIEWRL
ncbi:hypothetical protein RvY_08602-1 [Ramazzottius varieornatus]|uniref:Secreted protein n=1 Tax=Ramazzottius varieornatus TaxID=947166 RepID=A0A1D1V6D2_RAMVA|nr:hypothetical protein RvY_08602-1 [Ramazzottius varieornatus]